MLAFGVVDRDEDGGRRWRFRERERHTLERECEVQLKGGRGIRFSSFNGERRRKIKG